MRLTILRLTRSKPRASLTGAPVWEQSRQRTCKSLQSRAAILWSFACGCISAL